MTDPTTPAADFPTPGHRTAHMEQRLMDALAENEQLRAQLAAATNPAAVDPQQERGGDDALARVCAWLDRTRGGRADVDVIEDRYEDEGITLRREDVTAVVAELEQRRDESGTVWLMERNEQLRDELEQLRADAKPSRVTCPVCQRSIKLTATGLIRYHGPHNRPCKGSGILPAVPSDAVPQQPEPSDGAR